MTWVPVSKKREHERGYDQAYLLAKLPGRLHMLPRKRAFDSFTAKYLDLTKRYTSNEELKKERNIFRLARSYEQKYMQKP